MLDVDDLYFSYGDREVLSGVSLTLKRGEIIALIGVSGSGKTTLFRLITKRLTPTSGSISGVEEITYMRQEDLLLPWRDALQNLLLFTELGKTPSQPSQDPLQLLEKVGLKGFENYYPHELSGGMRCRLSLARALLQNRPLLLLDEPFGSLDVILREELYTLLATLCREEQKGVLLVTHDFRDALSLADRILVLADGKIVSTFTTKDYQQDELIDLIRSNLLRNSLTGNNQ